VALPGAAVSAAAPQASDEYRSGTRRRADSGATCRRFPLTPLVYRFLCLVGALAGQLLLARVHDRQIARLRPTA
jgi:hypothetical protein